MISSYPSIYNLGHKAVTEIFNEEVLVEEKLDGSQFSFMLKDGELLCRSKGRHIILDNVDKLFGMAVETAISLKDRLRPDWSYRGECITKPKHNTLKYDRIPTGGIILFDVDNNQSFLSRAEKEAEAHRLGLEIVPAFFQGKIESVDQLKSFLDRESCLGGTKIEGFVVKNYNRFTIEKKVMMGKFVSEAFKEKHDKSWKAANPKSGDIVLNLITMYKTEARWQKAYQHLKDDGKITDTPQDIGNLIKEVSLDVLKEESDAIKEELFKWAWPKIGRAITGGLPEWYKNKLLEGSINAD